MADAEPVTQTVNLRYMVNEPDVIPEGAKSLLEGWEYQASEPLLNGPVSRRLAVVDIDPDTGVVLPGAIFIAPKGRSPGRYEIKNELDAEAADFQQVSVFGAIMGVMRMFEEPDVLGRPLRWAFDGEQLLVVPRAGRMANAFYHRESRSLQFFFFDDPGNSTKKSKAGSPGQPKPEGEGENEKLIYTCLSPDIVAHEATHAILDGIAPDLYDATSPQALALHEAIADLSAVIFAIRTRKLRTEVLKLADGDIRKAGAFSQIAKQFGEAIYGPDRPLRDLANKASLNNPPPGLNLNEPHDLSTVLTGALYPMLVDEYEKTRQQRFEDKLEAEIAERQAANKAPPSAEEKSDWLFSASGGALFAASSKFKRILFRGLDYLSPGEISFADYGRAIVAADCSSNPNDPEPREFIKAEFVRRGIIETAGELDPVDPDFKLPAMLDLEQLIGSDWAAYQFAEAHRSKLMIPEKLAFEMRPRLDVTKTTWRTGEVQAMTREVLIKVAWQETQSIGSPGGLFDEVSVTRGTTLVIDRETMTVRALLSTSPAHVSQNNAATRANDGMRASYLKQCIEDGTLELSSPDVQIESRTLRVRGLGQMLHVMGH